MRAAARWLWATPQITGTRRSAAATTFERSVLRAVSSSEAVSPVDPSARSPCTPPSITCSTRRPTAASSTFESFRKGEINAGSTPVSSCSSNIRYKANPGANVSWLSALAAEIVFSAALVTVVLNVAATRATAGNSFYGIAIGFTVAAGAFAAGPISGAAFNPAVGIGATVAGALFGHGSWSDLWLYLVGPFAGAAVAAGIHALQTPAEPVAPESSEQLQGEVD